jgi:hypothetical protein
MKTRLLSALTFALLGAGAFAQDPSGFTQFYTSPQEHASILPVAIPANVTLQCTGSTENRSGLAWNPKQQLYYSVNAGNASYPVETYDAQGHVLKNVAQGFDYRGLWWNPNTSALEGNGYSACGYCTQKLDARGLALGNATAFITGFNQPSVQSCAVYNDKTDEIITYANGNLYFYSHKDGHRIRMNVISGLPAGTGQIDSTSCIYTGKKGFEIGLYDFKGKAVYFIDLATAKYSGKSQLPSGTHDPDRFRFAYCNELVWIFDGPAMKWRSYNVFETSAEIPMLGTDKLPADTSVVDLTATTLEDQTLMDEVIDVNVSVDDEVNQDGPEVITITETDPVPDQVDAVMDVEDVQLTNVLTPVPTDTVLQELIPVIDSVPSMVYTTIISQYQEENVTSDPVEVLAPVPVTEPEVVAEPVVVEELKVEQEPGAVIDPTVQVKVFPNPVMEGGIVRVEGLETFEGTFTVFSPEGKQVLQMQVGTTEFRFNRGNLASGAYYYELRNSGGVVGSGKMIFTK